jgi:hypothetical protein
MDREPAVIRAEMNQTRAELGRKIGLLEARARELTPGRLSAQYVPDYMLERTIGAVLTLIGVRMAWSYWRNGRRRARVRAALESYGNDSARVQE